jgi:hypothetical protein
MCGRILDTFGDGGVITSIECVSHPFAFGDVTDDGKPQTLAIFFLA